MEVRAVSADKVILRNEDPCERSHWEPISLGYRLGTGSDSTSNIGMNCRRTIW